MEKFNLGVTLSAACMLAVGMSTALASAGFTTPEASVKSIYDLYGKNAGKSAKIKCNPNGEDGTGFPSNVVGIRRYLEPKLAEALVKSYSDGDIDWDPFIDGQDWCIRGLNISNKEIDGENTTLTVQFQNLGAAKRLRFEFRKAATGWLIYDVLFEKNDSLRKLVKMQE